MRTDKSCGEFNYRRMSAEKKKQLEAMFKKVTTQGLPACPFEALSELRPLGFESASEKLLLSTDLRTELFSSFIPSWNPASPVSIPIPENLLVQRTLSTPIPRPYLERRGLGNDSVINNVSARTRSYENSTSSGNNDKCDNIEVITISDDEDSSSTTVTKAPTKPCGPPIPHAKNPKIRRTNGARETSKTRKSKLTPTPYPIVGIDSNLKLTSEISESSGYCRICQVHQGSHDRLKQHLIQDHLVKLRNGNVTQDGVFGVGTLSCRRCHKSFGEKKEYLAHSSVANCFKCLFCDISTFKCTKEWMSHFYEVHGQYHKTSPWICPACPYKKGFASKSNLVNHFLVHMSIKFMCPICKEQYTTYRSIFDHLRNPQLVRTHSDKDIDNCIKSIL